jgi:hypothetical protein
MPVGRLNRHLLNSKDIVTIVGPDYNATTFMGRVFARLAMHAFKHQNEKP